jgi:hypothetical protein
VQADIDGGESDRGSVSYQCETLLRPTPRCVTIRSRPVGLGKWSALNESSSGWIFLSYRRQETAWPAAQLYDVLVDHFPAEQVFKDVDNIEPGNEFVERITAAVESCDVRPARIGRQWLMITNEGAMPPR